MRTLRPDSTVAWVRAGAPYSLCDRAFCQGTGLQTLSQNTMCLERNQSLLLHVACFSSNVVSQHRRLFHLDLMHLKEEVMQGGYRVKKKLGSSTGGVDEYFACLVGLDSERFYARKMPGGNGLCIVHALARHIDLQLRVVQRSYTDCEALGIVNSELRQQGFTIRLKNTTQGGVDVTIVSMVAYMTCLGSISEFTGPRTPR